MKLYFRIASPLLMAVAAVAAPVLTTGVASNNTLSVATPPSILLGGAFINFDSLAPFSSLASGAFSGQGIASISSPNGLIVYPFSTQSGGAASSAPPVNGPNPNEIFDNGAGGTANLTITLSHGTFAIGIGIADSDATSVTLEALGSNGAVLGSPFTVNVSTQGGAGNPGNGYYEISDTTADIFGLKILQTVSSANFSGLAIDDLQVAAPEPASLALLGVGGLLFGAFRLRRRA